MFKRNRLRRTRSITWRCSHTVQMPSINESSPIEDGSWLGCSNVCGVYNLSTRQLEASFRLLKLLLHSSIASFIIYLIFFTSMLTFQRRILFAISCRCFVPCQPYSAWGLQCDVVLKTIQQDLQYLTMSSPSYVSPCSSPCTGCTCRMWMPVWKYTLDPDKAESWWQHFAEVIPRHNPMRSMELVDCCHAGTTVFELHRPVW